MFCYGVMNLWIYDRWGKKEGSIAFLTLGIHCGVQTLETEFCTLRSSLANFTSFCLNYGSSSYDNNITIRNSVHHWCKQKLGAMIDSCMLGSSLGKSPGMRLREASQWEAWGYWREWTWDLSRSYFSELTDCRCRSMQHSTIWTPVLWARMDWVSDLLFLNYKGSDYGEDYGHKRDRVLKTLDLGSINCHHSLRIWSCSESSICVVRLHITM